MIKSRHEDKPLSKGIKTAGVGLYLSVDRMGGTARRVRDQRWALVCEWCQVDNVLRNREMND